MLDRRIFLPAVMASLTVMAANGYTAIPGGGSFNDEQVSLVYHEETGELAVDLPQRRRLGGLEITSEVGIFTGEIIHGALLGSFGTHNDHEIFLFRQEDGIPGSFSFGNIAQPQLSEDFLLVDLTVPWIEDLGGELPITGPVDLIYIPVPEPTAIALLLAGGLCLLLVYRLTTRYHPVGT